MAKLVGQEITTTLVIYSRSADGTKTEVDADATPTAQVEKGGEDWLESDDITVSHDDTGTYTFSWTPDESEEYEVLWCWEYEGTEYSQTEKETVESSIIGTSTSEVEEEDEAEDEPDLGTSSMCKVTGTFYDAGGNFMKGVYVRFTPSRLDEAMLTSGVIAQEVTEVSDENGEVSFYLVQGMTGMLSISGIGLVREVKVPEVGTTDIMDLAAQGDDLLEVQRPSFTKLPRRS